MRGAPFFPPLDGDLEAFRCFRPGDGTSPSPGVADSPRLYIRDTPVYHRPSVGSPDASGKDLIGRSAARIVVKNRVQIFKPASLLRSIAFGNASALLAMLSLRQPRFDVIWGLVFCWLCPQPFLSMPCDGAKALRIARLRRPSS